MNIEVNKFDIEEAKIKYIHLIGTRNLSTISDEDIKRIILKQRLIEGIKTIKKGDIIYRWCPYKDIIEEEKEYIVFKVGNNNSLFGSEDIIINKDGGYIAGGYNNRAVKKEDYLQYKECVEK